jgi:hypothetical protein
VRPEEAGDRGGGADAGEDRFAFEAVDVLAGGDEQLRRVLGADAEQCGRLRCSGGDERTKAAVEFVDLGVKVTDASGEAAERELGCLERFVQPAAVRGGA